MRPKACLFQQIFGMETRSCYSCLVLYLHGITCKTKKGCLQDGALGRARDVIFQRPEDFGRGHPQDVSRERPLALHRVPIGDVHGSSSGEVLRTSFGRNFAEWVVVVEFLESPLRTLDQVELYAYARHCYMKFKFSLSSRSQSRFLKRLPNEFSNLLQ